MSYMFRDATAFNGDLCSWQDTFPYTTGNTYNIFTGSNGFDIFLDFGCTYQDDPQAAQKGPFCASDCQSSSVVDQASALDNNNNQIDSETEEVETIDETSYPGDVEGFDYVGTGNCRDSGEQSYPSVTQIYTFSTEVCADFCMKVGVDQSLGVLRGYVWGGDIPGGLQIHCNCLFNAGADTEAIASQYGGKREHWGIMEPARFSTEGQGNGIVSGTAESDYEDYCYKVIDSEATTVEEPWEVEETSPLSTDTPSRQMTFPPYSFDSTFFSSSNTPTVAVCPEEVAAFQNCITIDVDNIGSFVDCSLCGLDLEAMGDDIFDFDGYCQRWDDCVSEMCPETCVGPINAFQRCVLDDSGILDLVDCFDTDSVTDPTITVSHIRRHVHKLLVYSRQHLQHVPSICFIRIPPKLCRRII